MDEMNASAPECTQKQGLLPACAPLAAGFIPMQQENPAIYGNNEALTRGTLFPGLDLPFMNIANNANPYAGTPLGELMAIDFVIQELVLYLDTHREDAEAFRMFRQLLDLSRQGQEAFTRQFGPVSRYGMRECNSYAWISDPWPWELPERMDK